MPGARSNRRGQGEGSIYEIKSGDRKGQWVAAMTVSLPGETQRKRRWYAPTRAEANAKMMRAIARGEVERRRDFGNDTVAQIVEDRLSERIGKIKERTIEQYRDTARLHIDPLIGKRRAADLDADDMDRFFAALARRGVSPHVQRQVRAVLSGAFRWAMRRRRMTTNPLDYVESVHVPRRRMKVWDADSVGRFLEAAHHDDLELRPLYVVALSTGLRIGELLALRWEDVDLAAGVIAIQETSNSRRGKPVEGEAKTEQSIRRVVLPQSARDVLRRHHTARKASRYVFPGERGGALHARNVRERSFKPLMRLAKVPKIRFHDMRHTFATLALQAGVPLKVVSETLGHADPSFTARVYQHVIPSMQDAAAAALDDIFRVA